ncbi:hypothetical protein [Halomonas sp. DQ26W]|uniref:hypothetical protein n=1 Tax=Halomonas sp. DQ26W TaxID=2282311 RepID=UPI001C69C3E6|nr:hypothetical protein [Halomonas sp. DQ26W]
MLTLTPHDLRRHSHALHHASSGNLDRPRIGGIDTLTVREFRDLPRRQQLRYRLYRHPLVLFGLGPAYLFLLDHRLPVAFMRAGWMPWLSTMGTNAAIALPRLQYKLDDEQIWSVALYICHTLADGQDVDHQH